QPVRVTDISGDVTALMLHLRRYLSGRGAASGAYLFLAAGPQSHYQKTTLLSDHVETAPSGDVITTQVSSTFSDHFFGVGAQAGLGFDAPLGRRLSLGLTAGAQVSARLGSADGDSSGFSLGARLGYRFGPVR